MRYLSVSSQYYARLALLNEVKTGQIQLHHKVPWNNKAFNHANHPLVKQTGVNLKHYKSNLLNLGNHSGRHSSQYHQGVQNILNKYYRSAIGKGPEAAQTALEKALSEIESAMQARIIGHVFSIL